MDCRHSRRSRAWFVVRGAACQPCRASACSTTAAASSPRVASASLLACVALAAGLVAAPADAQSTWQVTSGTWSLGSNWVGGVPAATGTAVFNASDVTTDATVFLGGPQTIGRLEFQSGDGVQTTLRSNAGTPRVLTIGAGGITVSSSSANVFVGVTGSLVSQTLSASQTWANNSTTGTLYLNGARTTAGTNPVVLTIDGVGRTEFNASSLAQIATATASIVKNGSGYFLLAGSANTFSGGVTLKGGTLALGSNTALGATSGTFTIANNGVSIDVTSARSTTNNNAQVWNGDFTFLGTSTFDTGTGAVTLGGDRIITTNASVLTVGGVIDDGANTYSLQKSGSGVLQLNAANTFDGGVTFQSGTLRIGSDSALGTGTITFAGGALSGTGATLRTLGNAVAVTGDGTIGEAATNTAPFSFHGAVNLGASSGTLTVLSTATFAGAVSGAGGLTKSGASTLVLSASNSYAGPTTISAGNLTISDAAALGDGAAALNANGGTLSIGSGLDIVRTGPITVAGGTISGGTLTNNGSALNGRSGRIDSVLAGSGGLAKSGNGLLVLSGTNTFGGPVVINGGTLRVTSQINNGGVNGALGSASNAAANLTIDGGVLEFSSGTSTASDRGITIGANGGGIANASTNTTSTGPGATGGVSLNLSGPLVLSGAGDRTITLTTSPTSDSNGWLTSGISDPTSGGKTSVLVTGSTASSTARWDFFGDLNFTGGLTVGIDSSRIGVAALRLGGTFHGLAGGVTINPGSLLRLETGTLTTWVANAGTVNTGPGNNQPGDFTLSGVISGTGSIVSSANTTLASGRVVRLTGTANTYTGFTQLTMAGGAQQTTLVVTKLADYGQASSIGASASTGNPTTDAANLRFGSTVGTGTGISMNLRYTGGGDSTNRLFMVQTSATAAAPNTSGGVALLNDGSGSLNFTSTDAIPFANGTNGYGMRLTLGGTWSGTNSFAPAWSDNGTDAASSRSSLLVTGSGAWIVSGTNSHSGGTTLGGSASGANATLILGNRLALGSGTLTISNQTVSSGGLASSLDLSGANAVTNAVALSSNARIAGSHNLELAGVVSSAGNRQFAITNTATTTFSAANTYTGTTSVEAGVLVLNNANALPAASNLRIGAGVIGLTGSSGNFTRALGTGIDSPRVQITGSNGGFAAIDGNRDVDLGGAGATVTWGVNSFMTAATGTFRLGAAGAAGTLDFKNPIALAGTEADSRSIFVEKGASLTDARLSGAMSGASGVRKLGAGVLELTGQNTYTGTTTVAAGTLLVNGTNSGGGRTLVEVGATLGGAGRIDGLVEVLGTLAPGNSPGVLEVNSLLLSGTTAIEIGGTTRGIQHDGIDLLTDDGLTYGGVLNFDITSLFAASATLDIFHFTGFSGGFGSVTATGAYGSFAFTEHVSGVWQYTSSAGNPYETTITFREATGDIEFAVVPEPGTSALAGAGIAMAMWRLRRRRV